MSDHQHCHDPAEADWVLALLEKHDLYLRADTPQGGVFVLVSDAASDLKAVADGIIKERTVTPALLAEIKRLSAILEDAMALATVGETV